MNTASEDNKKVVIIDDEVDLSLLLQSYLKKKGYHVQIAHTIAEGLEAIAANQPRLVFLDNNLPDGTGWEIAPQISREYPALFIFLISAFHPTVPILADASRYMVLEKPVTLSAIEECFATKGF